MTDQKSLNVILKEDTEILDEVVVVGYGVQKKKLVTGATVQVKGESLAKMNTNSPLQDARTDTWGEHFFHFRSAGLGHESQYSWSGYCRKF